MRTNGIALVGSNHSYQHFGNQTPATLNNIELWKETSKKTEGLDAVEHKLNYEEETV